MERDQQFVPKSPVTQKIVRLLLTAIARNCLCTNATHDREKKKEKRKENTELFLLAEERTTILRAVAEGKR